jgi:hypothetical protein
MDALKGRIRVLECAPSSAPSSSSADTTAPLSAFLLPNPHGRFTLQGKNIKDYFEVFEGLLGVNRDVFIILLKYLPDSMIREVWSDLFCVIDDCVVVMIVYD